MQNAKKMEREKVTLVRDCSGVGSGAAASGRPSLEGKDVLWVFLQVSSQAQGGGRGSRVPLLVTAILMGQRMRSIHLQLATRDHRRERADSSA